jgi:hypothetical protein
VSPIFSLIISWAILGSISLIFIDDYLENHGHGIVIDTAVGWWIEKVGVMAIFVALFGIWYQRRESTLREKDRHARSCRSILKELEDHENTLADETNYERISINNNTISISDVVLSTDVYNSIIQSGLFTYFSAETQNELTGLYNRIKLRNNLLLFLDQYDETLPAIDDDYLNARWEKLENQYLRATIWEKEIKELIKGSKILIVREMS